MHFEIFGRIADSPAVTGVVALIPPAIENAEIGNSIHSRFLAAGAAGFQRSTWIVQPDIHALCQEVSRVHLVIFNECDMSCELRVESQGINLMDQMLAMLIGGMRLSRKHDLYRTPPV